MTTSTAQVGIEKQPCSDEKMEITQLIKDIEHSLSGSTAQAITEQQRSSEKKGKKKAKEHSMTRSTAQVVFERQPSSEKREKIEQMIKDEEHSMASSTAQVAFEGELFSEEKEKIEQMIKDKDHSGLLDYVTIDINKWKSQPLNIGVIGASGVGKSSFINKIRGVKRGDPMFAKVGFKGDTTVEKKSYPHPNNANVVFWDLPGVGTQTFRQDQSYLDFIEIEKIDFFLIMYVTTLHEGDIWITQQLDKYAKRYSFIVTHIDRLYDDEDLDDQFTPSERIDQIKEKCQTTLELAGLPRAVSVYAISNKNIQLGEFQNFVDEFFERLDFVEKEALALTLATVTKGVIEEKAKALKAKTWKVAITAVFTGNYLIPETDIDANTLFLDDIVKSYLHAFELTEEHLRDTLGDYDKTQLKCQEIHRMGVSLFCCMSFMKIVMDNFKAYAFNNLVPVFGSLIFGVQSFWPMYSFLNETIDKLAEDATKILGVRITASLPTKATTNIAK